MTTKMAIALYGEKEIEAMRRAGRVAAATLAFVAERLEAGMALGDIDQLVREDTRARGARPSQLGYHGFPAAVCVSRNEVVCHGIPRATERLEDGDIVNVDVTSELGGFHGDTSATFLIGRPSADRLRVYEVARRALWAGIRAVKDGARLGDVGAAIEAVARSAGCGVVREFGGHGIGRAMHQDPHVPHYGPRGHGVRLRAGMTITIEPMITLGDVALTTLADGWTVVTADGSPSAQFEHTVLVTKHGAEVLTPSPLPVLQG